MNTRMMPKISSIDCTKSMRSKNSMPVKAPSQAILAYRAELEAAYRHGGLWIGVFHPSISARLARLTVRDQGVGIEAHDLQRIFGRFERAAPSAHYAGFGLGLWVARAIVEKSAGTIEVESEPGKGTTFIIELPAAPQDPALSNAG